MAKTLSDYLGLLTGPIEEAAVRTLQGEVDNITSKAQRDARGEITSSEREFLKGLYRSIAVGGSFAGMPEASQLLKRYLENKAVPPLVIAPTIYQQSHVVRVEIGRQKTLIAAAMKRGESLLRIEPLHIDRHNHMLIAEQSNKRLYYANNRFWLHSATQNLGNQICRTLWSVPDKYEFEDFASNSKDWRAKSKHTDFPLHHHRLRIYDGLSKYLVDLDLAKEFAYYSEWNEEWRY